MNEYAFNINETSKRIKGKIQNDILTNVEYEMKSPFIGTSTIKPFSIFDQFSDREYRLIEKALGDNFNNFIRTRITSVKDVTITDFNIIVPDKVVEVIFADGIKIKMVLQKDDTFNIESLCEKAILKKIFDKEYYKLVKTGTKAYAEHFKREIEEQAEQERVAKKKEKLAIKRVKRAEKLAKKEKEKWVDIMTESINRSLLMSNSINETDECIKIKDNNVEGRPLHNEE